MKDSLSYRIFRFCNVIFLVISSVACIIPLVNLLAISLSSASATTANKVFLWPVDFTWENYTYILENPAYKTSMLVSVLRVIIGTLLSTLITVITAYPLARSKSELPGRNLLMWFFVVPMVFGGGLIPYFLTLNSLHLIDTFAVLIIPTALSTGNVILMVNFFKGVPKSLEEAAVIDGANAFTVMLRVYMPLSMAAIAALSLFAAVGHWNSWFDGLVYINRENLRPLQSTLMVLMNKMKSLKGNMFNLAELERLSNVNDRSLIAAQIFVGTLPILLVYPFLQKYFVTGVKIGAVKE